MNKLAEIKKEAEAMGLEVVDITDRDGSVCIGCVGNEKGCLDMPECSFSKKNKIVNVIFINKKDGEAK